MMDILDNPTAAHWYQIESSFFVLLRAVEIYNKLYEENGPLYTADMDTSRLFIIAILTHRHQLPVCGQLQHQGRSATKRNRRCMLSAVVGGNMGNILSILLLYDNQHLYYNTVLLLYACYDLYAYYDTSFLPAHGIFVPGRSSPSERALETW